MKNFVLDIRENPDKDAAASPKCEMLTTDVFCDEDFKELKPMVMEIIGEKDPVSEFKDLLRDPDYYLALRNHMLVVNYLVSNDLELVPCEKGRPSAETCVNNDTEI